MRKLRLELPSKQNVVNLSSLSAHERKLLKGFLPARGHRMGFRTWMNTPAFRELLAEKMEIQELQQRDKCAAEGLEYVSTDPFSAKEKIKVQEWNKLDESQKEYWRENSSARLESENIEE